MKFYSKHSEKLGIEEVDANHCKQLVGIGTDGGYANIANAGLKGIVESKLKWIVWMWYYITFTKNHLRSAMN